MPHIRIRRVFTALGLGVALAGCNVSARQAPQFAAAPPQTQTDMPLDAFEPGEFDIAQSTQRTPLPPPRPRHIPPHSMSYYGPAEADTIIVVNGDYSLYHVTQDSQTGEKQVRIYKIGTGRDGFLIPSNAEFVVREKQEWPAWYPPAEMRVRQPYLPAYMAGGPNNPLGARALYLYEGKKRTLFRIHGTSEPHTIGTNVSSGCFRLVNEDVIDLYNRVKKGTRVKVMDRFDPHANATPSPAAAPVTAPVTLPPPPTLAPAPASITPSPLPPPRPRVNIPG